MWVLNVEAFGQNRICIFILTALKIATRVVEIRQSLLCNQITFINPSVFVSSLNKNHVKAFSNYPILLETKYETSFSKRLNDKTLQYIGLVVWFALIQLKPHKTG